MAVNLPVAFASIFAGAVVIRYGTDNVKQAFASSPAGSPSGSGSGSPSGSGSAKVGAGGGAHPLPGVTLWERTDQGVDASAKPGSPVQSIYTGVVSMIVPDFYNGQPAVVVDTPGLPGGATGIYYAEQLLPNVHVGEHVSAGEQIGTVAPSGTGLELGLWKGTRTLAQATTGYTEGAVTHAGVLMRELLKSLGIGGL